VTVRLTLWRGAFPRAMLLALGVALIPLPVAAGDTAASPKTRNLQASMARIVARDVGSTRPVAARRAEQGRVQGTQSATFFKTRTGAVIAAVMIAGTGYALYSAQHDRIHSAGKK
jgi:hypothetical protein